jgi:hypothetical protein
MKRFIAIATGVILAVAINAQDKFSVPVLTDLQKYQSAAWQWHGAYIGWLAYGKSLGKSAEETGKAVGDILKKSWNKDIGFEGFANSMLFIWVTFVPGALVEIIQQSDNALVFIVRNFNPPVKEALVAYSVTFEEYMKLWDSVIGILGENVGMEYSQKLTENGLEVTIKQK